MTGRDLAFLTPPSRELCGQLQKTTSPCSKGDFVLCLFAGILHKGNGENQFVSQQPPVIGSIMGNGRRRSISCPSCNGLADGNKLLAPVALTCGSDGSLYVGDFNYIRRIFPSGNVTNILELRYITHCIPNNIPLPSYGPSWPFPPGPEKEQGSASAVRLRDLSLPSSEAKLSRGP